MTGLIRNPEQVDDLREAGAQAVLCDLESATVEEVTEVLRGADAAVFAAARARAAVRPARRPWTATAPNSSPPPPNAPRYAAS
ncbi:NAD(P)H-binding protein [Actinomadura keratinilytica]